MSLSSLEQQFKDAGIAVKRGVKVRTPESSQENLPKQLSNLWVYRWARNSYRNYSVVSRARGVRDLADRFKGLAAFIVGIGPSLDDAMPYIGAAVDRGVIIAVDAAFRPLMANGIRPDIVVSYDCKPEQKLLWETVPQHNVPLVIDSCAHPDTVASWKGPILFYNHYHEADELSHVILPHVYPHIGQIPSGATVGNAALFLSKLMGCDTSVVIGYDFCYGQTGAGWRYRSRDYKFNVETSTWEPLELKLLYDNSERVQRSFAVDIKGVKYQSDPELVYYHETFIKFVTYFKIRTINTSPQGALKDSLMTIPLNEAIARFTNGPTDIAARFPDLGSDPRAGA